jgi:hypothetical protein
MRETLRHDDSRLTSLERRIIELMVAGDSAEAVTLQAQLEAAEVASRSYGPEKSGLWVDLAVPEWIDRLEGRGSTRVSNLSAVLVGDDESGRPIESEMMFILHVQMGEMVMLEGVSQGPWPKHARLGRHWYHEQGAQGLRVHLDQR